MDDEPISIVHTDGPAPGFGRLRFGADDGRHSVSLVPVSGQPVTVLGISAERAVPGVIVDTLGIVGARAREQLDWDAAVYAAQLAARRPDLLVFAYGTNEAMDVRQPIEQYEADLLAVVARAQRAAPDAACLLVGPSDHPRRVGRRYRDRARTGKIIAAQERVAEDLGCATFDLVAVTGGPRSMHRLVIRRPFYGAPDHVHFTREGYGVLGDALTGALLRGYRTWLATRPEGAEPEGCNALSPPG